MRKFEFLSDKWRFGRNGPVDLPVTRKGASMYIWSDKMVCNYLVVVANTENYSPRSEIAMITMFDIVAFCFCNYEFWYFDHVYSCL